MNPKLKTKLKKFRFITSKGFSLVELLVVVAIIGVPATVPSPSIRTMLQDPI